jgi:hypothetical protein
VTIAVLLRDAATGEIHTCALPSDHPARVGAEHMPLGKVPVGAAGAHVFVDRWIPIVGLVRIAGEIDDEILASLRAVAGALNTSAARRKKLAEDFPDE